MNPIHDDPKIHIAHAEEYLRVAKNNSDERSKWAIGDIEDALWHLERAKEALRKISQDPKWDINIRSCEENDAVSNIASTLMSQASLFNVTLEVAWKDYMHPALTEQVSFEEAKRYIDYKISLGGTLKSEF